MYESLLLIMSHRWVGRSGGQAIAGDFRFWKEVVDRVDGPVRAVDFEGDTPTRIVVRLPGVDPDAIEDD